MSRSVAKIRAHEDEANADQWRADSNIVLLGLGASAGMQALTRLTLLAGPISQKRGNAELARRGLVLYGYVLSKEASGFCALYRYPLYVILFA